MGRHNRRIQELLAQKDGHDGSGIDSLNYNKSMGGFRLVVGGLLHIASLYDMMAA